MIDAAIAQRCCSRICIRSSGVEAHGRIQRGGTATADQVTDSGYTVQQRNIRLILIGLTLEFRARSCHQTHLLGVQKVLDC
jgi:hypothetical protein